MGFSNLITKAVATTITRLPRGRSLSVCELGNQTLKNSKARGEVYAELGITPPARLNSTRDWYESVGFRRYMAIDVNTERDAVAMDLNVDIGETYGFRETFDLVTNNGTGEHVFNQYMLFKNAHDLCNPGGFMVHVLPFYRWVDHGFYNYNPNLFPCLANQNAYDMQDLWIATSDASRLEKLNPANLRRRKGYREDFDLDSWSDDPMIAAVFQKTRDQPFACPIQNLYGGSNISSSEISERYL